MIYGDVSSRLVDLPKRCHELCESNHEIPNAEKNRISNQVNTPSTNESHRPFELGIYSFAELTPDPLTGKSISPAERLRNLSRPSNWLTRSVWMFLRWGNITAPISLRLPRLSFWPWPRRARSQFA